MAQSLEQATQKAVFLDTEKNKLHEQLLHYEVMETDFKALEKELKFMR